MYVSAVVEGSLDDAIVQRLAIHTGLAITAVHGKQGKAALLRDLPGYNKAARFTPWLALVDLDNDYDCVPAALAAWLPKPAPQMAFRVAVQMAEAWLLADRVRLGRFLQLPGGSQAIPKDPEQLADPKRELVNLARKSRTRAIREDLVPREGSGRPVGPAYTSPALRVREQRGQLASRRCGQELTEPCPLPRRPSPPPRARSTGDDVAPLLFLGQLLGELEQLLPFRGLVRARGSGGAGRADAVLVQASRQAGPCHRDTGVME